MKFSTSKTTLVICLSTSSFKAPIWTNKQHLMHRLSQRPGFKIIYIDQGMSGFYLMRAMRTLDWKYFLFPIRRINKNLITCAPYFLPLVRGKWIKNLTWGLVHLLTNLYFKLGNFDRKLYWVYQPQAWYLIQYQVVRSNSYVLYDCVDEFISHPFYKDSTSLTEELFRIEAKLVQKANLVTTTSKDLYKDKLKFNPNTRYVHNVGDYDLFKSPNDEILVAWRNDSRIKVIYAGVIDDYKTDLRLVSQIAQKLRNSHLFIFIGPIRCSLREMAKDGMSLENLIFEGQQPYKSIPSYLHKADILWLPYFNSSHTNRVFPIKLFEYLATGKPIVARDLRSLDDYRIYLSLFDSVAEAVHLLSTVLKTEDSDKVLGRKDIAKANTWDSRLNKILECIDF